MEILNNSSIEENINHTENNNSNTSITIYSISQKYIINIELDDNGKFNNYYLF